MKDHTVLKWICITIMIIALMMHVSIVMSLWFPPELTVNLNADDEFVEVMNGLTELAHVNSIEHQDLIECRFELDEYRVKLENGS